MILLGHIATMCFVVGLLVAPVLVPDFLMNGISKWMRGK